VIEVSKLTKSFGDVLAVDDLSFTVRPGEVTGFLGPNGAGKSTTLRMILGLDMPTAGSIAINGRRLADLPAPLREIGALLDARAVHPSRTAAQHLHALAASNDIAAARVPEVLRLVDLASVANRPAASFSMGMLQRLGLAAALLGDPPTLVLDEPLNGLDPEGIIWFREFMGTMAAEGRAVLMSSHLMGEVAVTANHLLVIAGGRLVADTSVDELTTRYARSQVRVRTPAASGFGRQLSAAGATVRVLDDSSLAVENIDIAQVGELAARSGVALHELAVARGSLEDAFLSLTGGNGSSGNGLAAHPGERAASAAPAVRAAAASAPPEPRPAGSRKLRVRFSSIVKSEFMKLVTARSARNVLVGSVAGGIVLSVLCSNSAADDYPTLTPQELREFDPAEVSLRGHLVAQLTMSILGAMVMTSEFGTGTIAATLSAVPQRHRVLAAKAVVVGGVGLPAGLLASAGGFLGGQAMLDRRGVPHIGLREPGAGRAIIGGGIHLAAAGLLGLGTGTMMRSTSGTVSSLFAVTLLIPAFSPAFPRPLPQLIRKYWPTQAGAQVMTLYRDPTLMSPWAGLGLMCAAAGGVLIAADRVFQAGDVRATTAAANR
jgi:ABC-2 type transport system ATP-binding protein